MSEKLDRIITGNIITLSDAIPIVEAVGIKNGVIVAPGALHHIIVRGIERRRIFSDDQDRDNFIERLGDIVTETETYCFA